MRQLIRAAVAASASTALALPAAVSAQPAIPTNVARKASRLDPAPTWLTVDGRRSPLDASRRPQLGWLPHALGGNERQRAYAVVVRNDLTGQVVWRSRRVSSSRQSWVRYRGRRLVAGATYRWHVRTWDVHGRVSHWARWQRFVVGIGDHGWSGAQWIRRRTHGNDSTIDYTLARRSFDLTDRSRVRHAYVAIAVEGQWQLRIDGHLLGTDDDYQMPGEMFYAVEGVRRYLTHGTHHVIGVRYASWPTTEGEGRPEGPVAYGPTGLLVRLVVDHADGRVETVVSDPSWRVHKDDSELTRDPTLRSTENSGLYVERVDARRALRHWATPGYAASSWRHAVSLGRHPLKEPKSCAGFLGGRHPCGFSHLVPMESRLHYGTARPVSVHRLADGSLVADFGHSLVGTPVAHIRHGVAGRRVTLRGSYRLANTTLRAPAPAGASSVTVALGCRVSAGDPVTIDAPADGYARGDPERRWARSVTMPPARPCGPGVVRLNRPLRRSHATGRWVESAHVGRSVLDTQTTDLGYHYVERAGPQRTAFAVPLGFRYLEVSGAGRTVKAHDITVRTTYAETPRRHTARFASSNRMLNSVFRLMLRSARYAAQQQFSDSPDRQDGQFLADAADESFATMAGLDERSLTRQAFTDFAFSQRRYWLSGKPGPGSHYGAVNAVYPDGDGKRDIPDFTEFFAEWVWHYYQLTGDWRTLRRLYPTIRNIARYVADNIPRSGPFAGLVYQLPGGGGAYRYGIVDWPEPMRYDTTVLNAGVSTVVNERAVEVFRVVSAAARVLERTHDQRVFAVRLRRLRAAINHKLVEPSGLYDDGLLPRTGTRISHHSEHDESFALTYDVAPHPAYASLGDFIAAQGMKQGPMDSGQLEESLLLTDRPAALVQLLTNATADGPAKILAENGTSMWEQWDPGCPVPGGHPGDSTAACKGPVISQSVSDSFSHGWGSVGLVGVLRGLLGIRVTGVGARTVTIAPPRVGLHAARGSVWTERGRVTVSWRHTAHGFHLVVVVPDNVRATVSIPDLAGTAYVASGPGTPHRVGLRHGRLVFTVGSGRSTVRPRPKG